MMIAKFKKALPWTVDLPEERRRRQALPHETVGINPTEVQMVEDAPLWTDRPTDYWCSAITLRKGDKDRPVIVVGKVEEVIKKLNGEAAL